MVQATVFSSTVSCINAVDFSFSFSFSLSQALAFLSPLQPSRPAPLPAPPPAPPSLEPPHSLQDLTAELLKTAQQAVGSDDETDYEIDEEERARNFAAAGLGLPPPFPRPFEIATDRRSDSRGDPERVTSGVGAGAGPGSLRRRRSPSPVEDAGARDSLWEDADLPAAKRRQTAATRTPTAAADMPLVIPRRMASAPGARGAGAGAGRAAAKPPTTSQRPLAPPPTRTPPSAAGAQDSKKRLLSLLGPAPSGRRPAPASAPQPYPPRPPAPQYGDPEPSPLAPRALLHSPAPPTGSHPVAMPRQPPGPTAPPPSYDALPTGPPPAPIPRRQTFADAGRALPLSKRLQMLEHQHAAAVAAQRSPTGPQAAGFACIVLQRSLALHLTECLCEPRGPGPMRGTFVAFLPRAVFVSEGDHLRILEPFRRVPPSLGLELPVVLCTQATVTHSEGGGGARPPGYPLQASYYPQQQEGGHGHGGPAAGGLAYAAPVHPRGQGGAAAGVGPPQDPGAYHTAQGPPQWQAQRNEEQVAFQFM